MCPYRGKKQYDSRKEANKALKHQPKLKARGISPYKCEDHWHLGSDVHRHIDKLLTKDSDETSP